MFNEPTPVFRTCKGEYREFNKETFLYETKTFENGLFHQWGLGTEEYDNGGTSYTVGIVELSNGKIIMPDPKDIQFTDREVNLNE